MNARRNGKRAVIYCRTATLEQDNQHVSALARQRRATVHLVDSLGLVIVAEYSDMGVSGRTLHRHGLRTLRTRMKTRNDFECILVADSSRLSRHALHRVKLDAEFAKSGVCVISAMPSRSQNPLELRQPLIASIVETQNGAEAPVRRMTQ